MEHRNKKTGNRATCSRLIFRNDSQQVKLKHTGQTDILFFVEQIILEERYKQQDNQDDSLRASHPVSGSEY